MTATFYSEAAQHKVDGTREIAAANFEGTVWQCLCGEKREDLGELEAHIAEEKACQAAKEAA